MPEQEIDLSKDKAVHLVGIGGAGMGAIAEVLATCLLYTSPSPRDS